MDAATKKWNGIHKRAARTIAIQSDKKTPLEQAFFLPGSECKCVKEALEEGAIDKNTKIFGVEKDAATSKLINKQLRDLFVESDIDNMQLTDTAWGERTAGPDDGKFDFAFFDFCGALNTSLAEWLVSNLGDMFEVGSQVAFTFSIQGRNNIFIREAKDQLAYRWGGINKSVNKQLLRKARFIYGSNNEYRYATIAAIYAIMSTSYKVEIVACEEYCDTTPMLMIKFKILDEYNPKYINAEDFVNACTSSNYFIEGTGYNKKQRNKGKSPSKVKVSEKELTPWQQLGCPVDMPRAKKAWVVIRAKQGQRPDWIKPADWAWHPINPNGNKRKKSA